MRNPAKAMEHEINNFSSRQALGNFGGFLRKCMFNVLSVGPVPSHISFIMDGNRRYAKKQNLGTGDGHRAGFASLVSMLVYCYELGIKYVSVYAFSIDNFKRRPDEVQILMDLMMEKIDQLLKYDSIVNKYGIRLHFVGNLKLLSDDVRAAADKAMKATEKNDKAVLLVCVAYTSCDEIVHAVEESCKEKLQTLEIKGKDSKDIVEMKDEGIEKPKNGEMDHDYEGYYKDKHDEKKFDQPVVKLVDIEKNMYMSVAPDPDVLVRTSGETRLSNYLLWQSAYCPLYSPAALWPEIGLWHLVWAVLSFQRNYPYLQKKKKQV